MKHQRVMENRNQYVTARRGGIKLSALTLWLIAITTSLPVLGQGFMVKPMRIEVAPRPGETVEVPLELRNTATDGPRALNLRLVRLSQASNGNWRSLELDEIDETTPDPASAHDWITLQFSSVQVAPLEPAEVMVRVETPPGGRGAYFAAVIAETPLPERIEGMVIRVRFLIPIIIEIQGRPVRQQVKISDLSMNYRPGEARRPATTLAALHVANQGLTFSRVHGELRIEMQQGERWRPVSRLDLRPRSIIPGMTLQLEDDLQRRLPSGTYRLRGQLYVDGRRVAPLDKTIEFKGDPRVDTLALDTTLIMEPEQLALEAVPGATRTTVVMVENPSEDPLQVRAEAIMPESLGGVAMGELRGDMLSAAPWVQIRPAEFTLRPEGRQNLRVITRIPREGVDQAHYYADLILHASYADGQSAGATRSRLTVANRAVEPEPKVAIERLSLARGEAMEYIVQGQFANVGNVHLKPGAEAELMGMGGRTAAQASLDGDSSQMLPLGVRQYSGSIDFHNVEVGHYVLRVRFLHDGLTLATRQLSLLVEDDEDDEKSVRIVED